MPERVETYVARRTFTVGDRVVHPGDPVPEAEQWRRPQSWINSGHISPTFRDMTKKERKAQKKAHAAEAHVDDPPGLEDLGLEDLQALAEAADLDIEQLTEEALEALTDEERAEFKEALIGLLTPADEPAKVPEADGKIVLEDLTVPDLRAYAKDHGLKGYSKLKKPELIKLITKG